MTVIGADGSAAGTVKDVWVDRAEAIVRYLEVDVPTAGRYAECAAADDYGERFGAVTAPSMCARSWRPVRRRAGARRIPIRSPSSRKTNRRLFRRRHALCHAEPHGATCCEYFQSEPPCRAAAGRRAMLWRGRRNGARWRSVHSTSVRSPSISDCSHLARRLGPMSGAAWHRDYAALAARALRRRLWRSRLARVVVEPHDAVTPSPAGASSCSSASRCR